MNCMCPKPIAVDIIDKAVHSTHDYPLAIVPPFLHGKKADRFCERCGRGLCETCQVLDAWEEGSDPWGMWIWKDPEDVKIYCQACKEDLK